MSAAKNKVRWGVLGAAGIARRRTIPEGIVPADNAELVAVFDPVGGEDVANEFGVTACKNEEALLAQDIDAVYIATPVFMHNEQILAAAVEGKHVLCEKPLGLTVDEAKRALQTCNEHSVKLGTALMMRFHACHAEAKKLIESGEIGTPVLGRAQLSCWYPPMEGAWRQNPAKAGGGSLMDMGCHCTDLLEMLFGRIASVTCQTANLVHDYESEDTATVLLRFANGAMGMVDTLFNVPDNSALSRLEIYGSKGSIMSEGTIGQGETGSLELRIQASDAGYDAQQQRDDGGARVIEPKPFNPYRGEIEHFSQAILDDTDPIISGELGVWTQRVMAACYESARTGKTVEL